MLIPASHLWKAGDWHQENCWAIEKRKRIKVREKEAGYSWGASGKVFMKSWEGLHWSYQMFRKLTLPHRWDKAHFGVPGSAGKACSRWTVSSLLCEHLCLSAIFLDNSFHSVKKGSQKVWPESLISEDQGCHGDPLVSLRAHTIWVLIPIFLTFTAPSTFPHEICFSSMPPALQRTPSSWQVWLQSQRRQRVYLFSTPLFYLVPQRDFRQETHLW